MILRRGQQLLLPANPLFIWSSLLVALLLNMLQNIGFWGRAPWIPDMLALVLVFWSVHQPLRVGIGAAFVFGLFGVAGTFAGARLGLLTPGTTRSPACWRQWALHPNGQPGRYACHWGGSPRKPKSSLQPRS